MKTLTIKDIRALNPCYDPSRYFSEDWTGTIIDLLEKDEIPFEDRLWVVLRKEFVSEKTMRLFAVWSARQVQHLMTDQRSITALDVAEKFANGLATDLELHAARDAAWYAARDAMAAARDAAWYAARGAAWYAARAAASDAARGAARGAARDAQKNKIIEMIKKENGIL